jgi:hypothetical protein
MRRLRDTGALRRLRDTGAMRAIMDTGAMRALLDTAAMQMLRERYRGRGKLIMTVAVSFWVLLAVAALTLVLRPGSKSPAPSAAASAGSASGKKPTFGAPTKPGSASGSTGTSTARALPIASAEAFGPVGTSDGDNPGEAPLVITGGGTRAWHSRAYLTAHLGGVQLGTGLVLDMGAQVTVSKVTLELATGTADVTIRVGNTAVPGTFTHMVKGTGVSGTVTLTASPVRGRYIEIWFTVLPRDPQGTYRESVYSVKVFGQP